MASALTDADRRGQAELYADLLVGPTPGWRQLVALFERDYNVHGGLEKKPVVHRRLTVVAQRVLSTSPRGDGTELKLYDVEAQDEDGVDVAGPLCSSRQLPIGELLQFEVRAHHHESGATFLELILELEEDPPDHVVVEVDDQGAAFRRRLALAKRLGLVRANGLRRATAAVHLRRRSRPRPRTRGVRRTRRARGRDGPGDSDESEPPGPAIAGPPRRLTTHSERALLSGETS